MDQDKKATEKEKILIADDVEANRLVLESIIEDMGYTAVLAEDGQQALEQVKQCKPMLILSDISMPKMTGYELCRCLKSAEETRNLPIIFISAFDEPENIVKGFEIGGADYITKPFIMEEVKARVGVHMRLYKARRELLEMNRRLQVSVGEQLRQMELEKKNILYALANIAAKHASYDSGHIDRLKQNCRILAQGMQLSPLFEDKISDTFIDTIELAVPLCDIGNIGVPVEVLRKETPLTKQEEAARQSHTSIGAKLLKDLCVNNDYNDFIKLSIDIAQSHHENWDGSGYPQGLKQEEIPVSAQIVSIMEDYCELTGKEGCTREETLERMSKAAGVKYNPDIFNICRKISRQLC